MIEMKDDDKPNKKLSPTNSVETKNETRYKAIRTKKTKKSCRKSSQCKLKTNDVQTEAQPNKQQQTKNSFQNRN